ncbi:hypothetical protein TNCV_1557521 [Trichonephila clavipes]|nr:hypothetical protein TNCV_1557521 [Trichonephila clavipes]
MLMKRRVSPSQSPKQKVSRNLNASRTVIFRLMKQFRTTDTVVRRPGQDRRKATAPMEDRCRRTTKQHKGCWRWTS